MIKSFNDLAASLKAKGICKKMVVAWGVDSHTIEAASLASDAGYVKVTLVGDVDMIQAAAREYLGSGAKLLIFTGGMSVDPDDVTPTAIRNLGADIVTHGVPSQPGNMTLVGYAGDAAILGVPGAAISLPTTMFDVLLPQIFAGDRFTKEELIRLGDGGLCLQCKVCHFPACTFGRY